MGFYCTFLFSDPAEFELLVGKIITEDPLVEQWFVVEGNYSFKGEFKGLRLRAMIQSDARLKPYLSRINIFEISEKILRTESFSEKVRDASERVGRKALGKNTSAIDRGRIERKFFEVEKYSRDVPTSKILEVTKPGDWLFITDVDEIINATSGSVRSELNAAVDSGAKFIQVQRRRYVYDFDNLDPRFRTVPLINIELISGHPAFKISNFRFLNNGIILPTKNPPVVEFSYCFSVLDIHQKLRDFAHLPPPDISIQNALKYNHHLRYPSDTEENVFWFGHDERIEDFLPSYFNTNLENLRTNTVNKEYLKAREIGFPRYFSSEKESS
jgi:hypothetical protein